MIGSSVKTAFRDAGTAARDADEARRAQQLRRPRGEAANIGLHIGRRPILAFGNSDGDLAMLRYTQDRPGARLALLLHHDDAEREFAYDREFRLSPLAEALDKADDYGITVVSMKHDWKTVFDPTQAARSSGGPMKEWLVFITETRSSSSTAMALVVIVVGTVEAFVGGVRADVRVADGPRTARCLAALRALAGRRPDLPARGRHHRNVDHHELGRDRAHRRHRRDPDVPQLLPRERPRRESASGRTRRKQQSQSRDHPARFTRAS